MVQSTNVSYIATTEVSVGDWMVYMMATSFTEGKQPIKLGDHYDKISSKLPALEPGR